MPSYHYQAVHASRKKRKGRLIAKDAKEAALRLKGENLFILDLKDSHAAPSAQLNRLFRAASLSNRTRAHIIRQLATLCQCGVSLVLALRILSEQQPSQPVRDALASISDQVQSGSSFSEGLRQHPELLDPLEISIIEAGEAGGSLSQALERVALFLQKKQKLRSKVIGALAYPSVVLVITLLIFLFLLTFIVPRFERIFADTLGHQNLPLLTEIVVTISRFTLASSWPVPYILLFPIACAAGYRTLRMHSRISRAIDAFWLRFPLLGPLFSKTTAAHLTITLGILLQNGLPLTAALALTQKTLKSKNLQITLDSVSKTVHEGSSLASALTASERFDPMLISMVRVGEETGRLSDMLLEVGRLYEEEVEQVTQTLTALIEPLMIVILAVVVGTVVIALFMPLIGLVTELSNR